MRVPRSTFLGGDDIPMTAMEMIHQQTEHQARVALIAAVFSTTTLSADTRDALIAHGLIDTSGYPTQLGREYATWLINIGDRR